MDEGDISRESDKNMRQNVKKRDVLSAEDM